MKFFEKPYAIPLLTFAITFITYILTLAPDVTFTDAGELAAVAATLGVAHPTGYPLFTLLGHLWTMLPLPGTVIYRMNLFAAVCTAASAGVFAILVRYFLTLLAQKAGRPAPKALIVLASSLLYGFGLTIWEQALSVEVYSLQLLLFTTIIYLFLRAIGGQTENRPALLTWAFVLGLGFANHGTTILLAPAMIYLYFWRPSGGRPNFAARSKTIALLAVPFVLGLSVWLYLPLHAASDPTFNWGGVHRSFDKFWYHASGKQFQIWMFKTTELSANFKLFMSLIPKETGWVGLIALFAGISAVWKSSRRLFLGVALLVIGCLVYSLTYTIHDIEAYFSLAFIALLLLTAAGLEVFSRRKEKFWPAAMFAPAVMAFGLNISSVNQSGNYLVPEYTRIMTENLAPNAVILSHQWDYWCSAFWYKQQVEGYRPDVVLVETELLRRTWYADKVESWYPKALRSSAPEKKLFLEELEKFESGLPYDPATIQSRYEQLLNSYINNNYGKRPIYVTGDVIQEEPAVAADYSKIPEGFAWRLVKKGDTLPNAAPNTYKIDVTRFANSLQGSDGHLEKGIRTVAIGNLMAIADIAERAGDAKVAADAQAKALMIQEGLPKKKRK